MDKNAFITGLQWFGAMAAVAMAAFYPFLKMWRSYGETRAASAQDGAAGVLYQQLSNQLTEQKRALDEVYMRYNDLVKENAVLTVRVSKLEECETMIERMKVKLDEKDRIIAERDSEVRGLMKEIIDLKDRIHQLEMRVAQDEQHWREQEG